MQDSTPPASALDGGGLDNDLLTALDEMLSFSGGSNAQPIETGCHLVDAFGGPSDSGMMLGLGDIPPLEQDEPVQQTAGSTSSPSLDQRRGKDVRAVPYAKPKPRRRKRPKDELDYLRAQVKDLEEELSKLSSTPSASSGSELETDHDDDLFRKWKHIADRQKVEADLSMVENLKLRSMLEGQLKAIEGGRRPRATSVSDDLIFAQLNVGLEAQYAEFDSVMGQTDLASLLQNSKGIETFRGADGIAFRHEDARLLPFLCLLCTAQCGVVFATILDELQLPKSRRFDICARLAMRRYFEQDRIVVQNSSSGGSVSSSTSVLGCAFRMALQIKPETTEFESEEEAREHIGEVTNLVVGSYHRNFGIMYQIIENLLFSDSTGGAADAADEHELPARPKKTLVPRSAFTTG
ncbi:Voltage-gated Ion Channel (VIC) Superfamily [Phytophthora cinnamomi]|uniref:Voltage-gated Ion Channel (VIC) Superfamily n=1 Tax=Phytophthora cinnamomi TaxID=4785 RepID=UPI00355AA014|nr:Voltage-gated Ion Channel (VIC) Superfamily [Phytophthora cinnamomi]